MGFDRLQSFAQAGQPHLLPVFFRHPLRELSLTGTQFLLQLRLLCHRLLEFLAQATHTTVQLTALSFHPGIVLLEGEFQHFRFANGPRKPLLVITHHAQFERRVLTGALACSSASTA